MPDSTPSTEKILSVSPAIAVSGLKKSYGYHSVLKGFDFKLAAGRHLVVAGRNGCGKTTLINILAGLLRPSAGKVLINGLDLGRNSGAVRAGVGYVGHAALLYPALSIRENLTFFGRLYGAPDLANRTAELIQRLDLGSWQNRRVSELSRGTQQRASIARGLLHQPALLLLDEPESGLDPAALSLLSDLLREYKAGGGAILAASHNLEFALSTADEITLLQGGRLVMRKDCRDCSAAALRELISGPARPPHGSASA